ncbi:MULTISPECIES: CPBP family intramembrane glutamic endopeptidase [Culturomica]|jgi:membrane protease YdiL (CAAX protease family)|uniref:CPBP family intramembrane glutamic endopeptidase n=1 Tax=Culturomica TaxID=1926651 RepID=UPI0009F34BE2|nr:MULTISPECIES: CPBP family intramembrane glutamic endopeptidase [Odoribacteraceae]RHV96624.1 CPBP family intramembrane metalloprotease [Odoribacter sp. OF09-27XD]HBO27813.1 CPBP family intramembrane metalloprotease [Culturomica sp.]
MYLSLKSSNNLPLYNPMYNIHRLKEIIGKANMIQFCLIVLIAVNLTKAIVHLPFKILRINDIQFNEPLINLEKPVLTVDLLLDILVFAPIIETALYQTLIFKFTKWLNFNDITIVLISAVCFGLMHDYSLFYMISTFFTGSILMYTYILRAKYRNKPYWSITLAHSTINVLALLMLLVFEIL